MAEACCCDGRSQAATQETTFGDQSVDKQRNDADVTQAQGNGNLNIAPAVAIFGNAGTWNAQGNGNEATANIDQSNSVEQSQTSTQKQSLEPHSGWCRIASARRRATAGHRRGRSRRATTAATAQPGRHAGDDLRRPDGRRAEERRRRHAEAGERQRQRVARRVLRREARVLRCQVQGVVAARTATTPRPSRARATGTRRTPGSTSRTRSPRRRKHASPSLSPSGARGWSPASDDESAGRASCPTGASPSERRGDDQLVDQPAPRHTSDHRPRA